MNEHLEDSLIIRRYLLGLAGQDLQVQVEERMLTDEAFFEELLIIEDQLVDQYLADALPQNEREPFETFFLSTPERKRKLRFSRALRRYISQLQEAPQATTRPPERDSEPAGWRRLFPGLDWIPARPLAYVVIPLLLGLGFLISWYVSQRYSPGPGVSSAGDPLSTMRVSLTPGSIRETGNLTRVVINPGIVTVQMHLALLRDDYPAYRAVLRTEGRVVTTADGLQSETTGNTREVIVSLPVVFLVPGDYHLELIGIPASGQPEPLDNYYFRIPGR